MNYYDETKEKIADLIGNKEFHEALRLIENELSVPYIPKEFEKHLLEMLQKIKEETFRNPSFTDEQIEWQAGLDIPLINVSGHVERNSMFPVNVDAPDVKPGQWVAVNTQDKRIDSWQRRLRSANCHVRSREEIIGAADSAATVERKLGFPADKTEILTIDGSENYIADLKNNDGKYHLRIVALGNMPHTVTPIMCDLSWSYMRRFAKDPETGKCLELF